MNCNVRVIVTALICFISFSACKKETIDNPQILKMSFKSIDNRDLLAKDIPVDIEGSTLSFSVPEGLDVSQLIASFEISGAKLMVGGVEQESRVTINDYSKSLTFEVLGYNGGQTQYTIEVIRLENDEQLRVASLILPKEANPHLLNTVNFEVKENRIFAVLPKLSNTKVEAILETSAPEVFLNAEKVVDGKLTLDLSQTNVLMLISAEGFKKYYTVIVSSINDIPHFYIDTEGRAPVVDKSKWLRSTIILDGQEVTENLQLEGRVRGRGNSTWLLPKKPYRFRLDEEASILGLGEATDWVLLANYQDYTSLLSATAFKVGELLEAPYTNTMIPVELTLNGRYQGIYLLTEQIQVGEHRVNIGNDGVLFELDSYFDEDYKFRSKYYNLPVNIKSPDLKSDAELIPIRSEFEKMEELVFASTFPENGYRDLLDISEFANWFIINHLTYNREINHPKSTYVHKAKDGKYVFGPIWDFDWGFGFDGNRYYFKTPEADILRNNPIETGSPFFRRLLQDPETKKILKEKWQAFRLNKLQQLYAYIENYGSWSKDAVYRNDIIWNRMPGSLDNDKARLKAWLQIRANYLDRYFASL